MSIIYSLVSRGDTVLSEWTSSRGNFQVITRDLLKRIDQFTDKKMSYFYGERTHFHIVVDGGLIYLCMADSSFQSRRAYAYLMDIKTKFLSKFGESWQNAIALQFDAQFSRILQQSAVCKIKTLLHRHESY
eukprot:TRINITY_DN1064_c1_g1_i1.p1 TRINITY_DN1064_c1_g1~~TRINITY_DN1064_c1_g1_i1.p1  ORF type:complete len:131 (-),score=9.83 TRINITY_DN1064_c1_g1_i1:105-497(-)